MLISFLLFETKRNSASATHLFGECVTHAVGVGSTSSHSLNNVCFLWLCLSSLKLHTGKVEEEVELQSPAVLPIENVPKMKGQCVD